MAGKATRTRLDGLQDSVLADQMRKLRQVFQAALSEAPLTRGRVRAITGFSKATVTRLVEDLLRAGYLCESSPPVIPGARGRRPAILDIPRQLGQVVGVSFGLRRTVFIAADVTGREIRQKVLETPYLPTAEDTVHWLVEQARRVIDTKDCPLLLASVAIPARVIDGRHFHNLPSQIAMLDGPAFKAALEDAFGCETLLHSDADSALSGILADGLVTADDSPVLLNMGTVLTMSHLRNDGSVERGRAGSFGRLSLIPFRGGKCASNLDDLLSLRGLEEFANSPGMSVSELAAAWSGAPVEEPEASLEATRVKVAFEGAVDLTVRILAATLDPKVIVFAGHLVPLVESVRHDLEERAIRGGGGPPLIKTVGLDGPKHAVASGAVRIATTHLKNQMLEGKGVLLLRKHQARTDQPDVSRN